MDKAAEAVKAAIMNGIDLIREGAGVDITAITFITQILATIMLFIFVRLFLWKTVTNIIQARKENVNTALKQREEALNEANNSKEEAKNILTDATAEAKTIIKDARVAAEEEKTQILQDASIEADKIKTEAHNQMEQERLQMKQDIKDEIIDVAYLLAQKITSAEANQKIDNDQLEQAIEEHLS